MDLIDVWGGRIAISAAAAMQKHGPGVELFPHSLIVRLAPVSVTGRPTGFSVARGIECCDGRAC